MSTLTHFLILVSSDPWYPKTCIIVASSFLIIYTAVIAFLITTANRENT